MDFSPLCIPRYSRLAPDGTEVSTSENVEKILVNPPGVPQAEPGGSFRVGRGRPLSQQDLTHLECALGLFGFQGTSFKERSRRTGS